MRLPDNIIGYDSMERIQKIHFIGIGGAGMSGIAEVLTNLGYHVSGSDISVSATTERLAKLGVDIAIGHDPSHIERVDVVVVSSAVDDANIEVRAARDNKIPVIPRAEMLAELMRFRFGIAIAGTHGKTTTTSLIVSILDEAGLDPTFVIGGRLNSVGTNAKLGQGAYLVAEADESDASFHLLQPMMAIVTNIDWDHMETYQGDYQKLQNAFVEFLHHVPFYGMTIICLDDPGVREILPSLSKPVTTYGTSAEADIKASQIVQNGLKTSFTVTRMKDGAEYDVTLNMPGKHNMLNALAAIAVASELAVSDDVIVKSLRDFKGIGRRFQVSAEIPWGEGSVLLVDDYGHHPNEILATLDAMRLAWPDRRSVMVFQPHRYTRTRDLFEDFVRVLSGVDLLVLMDVYAADEAHIPGADGRALSRAIRLRGEVNPIFLADEQELLSVLSGVLEAGDVLITMGAGSVGQIAATLPQQLKTALSEIPYEAQG